MLWALGAQSVVVSMRHARQPEKVRAVLRATTPTMPVLWRMVIDRMEVAEHSEKHPLHNVRMVIFLDEDDAAVSKARAVVRMVTDTEVVVWGNSAIYLCQVH